jgi:hypothetical protein
MTAFHAINHVFHLLLLLKHFESLFYLVLRTQPAPGFASYGKIQPQYLHFRASFGTISAQSGHFFSCCCRTLIADIFFLSGKTHTRQTTKIGAKKMQKTIAFTSAWPLVSESAMMNSGTISKYPRKKYSIPSRPLLWARRAENNDIKKPKRTKIN